MNHNPKVDKKDYANSICEPVRLMAVGDIMFGEHPLSLGFGIESIIDRKGTYFIFDEIAPILNEADLALCNLENMLLNSANGINRFESRYLKTREECVQALKHAGFNIVNLANNHALQHGKEALYEIIDLLDKHDIKHIGVKGYNSAIFDFGFTKIGFLGYCTHQQYETDKVYVEPINLEAISQDIRNLKESGVNFTIICLHWGDEFVNKPSLRQIEIGRAIIEMGGNIILGHHPHVLQGIERYKGGTIVYSLGNFVSDTQWNKSMRKTMVLSCEISQEGSLKLTIIPTLINKFFQPKIAAGIYRKEIVELVPNLSNELNDLDLKDPPYSAYQYPRYVKNQKNMNRLKMYIYFISNLHKYKMGTIREILLSFLKNREIDKAWEKVFRQIKSDPVKIISFILGKICYLRLILNRKIEIGKGVKILSLPIINIKGNCMITIGDNVLLNSRNKGYFGPLYSPVKLCVDHEGASIRIGNNTRIHGSCLHAYSSIEIGNNCLIAANTTIVDSDGHDLFPTQINERLVTRKEGIPIVVEDNVWIGLNCIVLKGVRIGEGSIIGAGSVVRDSIPRYSIAIGNPAVVVKRIIESNHSGVKHYG